MNTPRVELLRLGSRIRIARTALGYNQRDFAAACGLNRTYVGAVERGERNLTFSVLCTICLALACDVAALTQGIPDVACQSAAEPSAILKSGRNPITLV